MLNVSGPVYLGIPASSYFLLFVQVYVGIPARPCEGWSVKILPVRSTVVALPQNPARNHAFDPATTLMCSAVIAGWGLDSNPASIQWRDKITLGVRLWTEK